MSVAFGLLVAPTALCQSLSQVLASHVDTFNRSAFPGRLTGRIVSESTIDATTDRRAVADLVTKFAKGVRYGIPDEFSFPGNDEPSRIAYARSVVEPVLDNGSLLARIRWSWTNGPTEDTYAVVRPGATVGDPDRILEFLTTNFVEPVDQPTVSSACDNTKYRGVWKNVYGLRTIVEFNVRCRGTECKGKSGDGVQQLHWIGLEPKVVGPEIYCRNNNCWLDAKFVIAAGLPSFSITGKLSKGSVKIDVGKWAFTVIGPITVALDTVGCPECPCDPTTQPATSFRAPQKVTSVSSAYHEAAPVLSDDLKTIYFASTRPGGRGGADIWAAHRENLETPWSELYNVSELNSVGFDAPGSLRADQSEMFIVSDRLAKETNILFSTVGSFGWTAPVFVDALSSPWHDAAPRLTEDGLELWFATSRANYSQTIHRCSRASLTAPWSMPERVDSLDGPGLESSAHLFPDNKELVFHSNRSGGSDLFVSSRPRPQLPFGPAVPLSRANTSEVEFDPFVTSDGFSIYFARGTNGDIYRADRMLPLCRVTNQPRIGQTLDVHSRRDPGDISVLLMALGELDDSIPIPGFIGKFELDPASLIWTETGRNGSMGRFDVQVPVPSDPSLRGTILHFQSIVMDPSFALYLSEATHTTIER